MYITFAHGRADGRMDRHFLKKFYFFLLIKNIYTYLYLSRLFLKFHPPVTKVSTPFFSILEIGMKTELHSALTDSFCRELVDLHKKLVQSLLNSVAVFLLNFQLFIKLVTIMRFKSNMRRFVR